jgi:hypothetical protein
VKKMPDKRTVEEQYPTRLALAPIGARRLAAAVAGSAMAFFAVWVYLQNLRHANPWDGWIFWVPITLLFFTIGGLSWWFALRAHHPETRARIWKSWRAGRLVGGIGLAAGFVGPLLIWPDANLGPLLGILITGPLGFVVGALGALVFPTVRASG